MTDRPRLTLTGTVLDAPDPGALAAFYRSLLGWTVAAEERDWVKLLPPDGGPGLAVQREDLHEPPLWPARSGAQQMQSHLDIETDDLAAAVTFARGLGARLAEVQSAEDVRVCLDPAGHPFCFWTRI